MQDLLLKFSTLRIKSPASRTNWSTVGNGVLLDDLGGGGGGGGGGLRASASGRGEGETTDRQPVLVFSYFFYQ